MQTLQQYEEKRAIKIFNGRILKLRDKYPFQDEDKIRQVVPEENV